MPGRGNGRSTWLRLGFQDSQRALDNLEKLTGVDEEIVDLLSQVADPDLALLSLVSLLEVVPEPAALRTVLNEDQGSAMRLLSVLGASEALGQHLIRHPTQWEELTDPTLGSTRTARWALRHSMLHAVGAVPDDHEPVASLPDAAAADALRVEYRRHLVRLASRDLAHGVGMDDVAAELSDLATGTLEAALAIARARIGADAHKTRIAVIAMGKCGAHELNYVSDVDVIFVAEPAAGLDTEPALRIATKLASELMKTCSEPTAEGEIWPVDAALRPEGKAGPLVRTVASHVGYYDRWASTWEFQALLKARAVAGDSALGREYIEAVRPFIWTAAERDGFVGEVQAMRRRVLEHIPNDVAARQLKLGSGGLRDVEFAIQMLQMVHGRGDDRLRAPTTLSALAELTRGGYIGREDGESLHLAYAFLRKLEHRLQMFHMQRVQVVPEGEEEVRRLGRAMGFFKQPVEQFNKAWRHHRREVKRLHEKLFYRPLLDAVASVPGDALKLSPQQAGERLAALGFLDSKAALRHLQSLTSGVSRTAGIQRTLLPVMLEWFADSPDPDGGLFGFRRISDSLGRTPWYLKLLRDEGEVAERLAHILGTSRYATDLLEREPEGVKLLASDLAPLSGEAMTSEMLAVGRRQTDPEAAVRTIRGVRRRELLRIAAGNIVADTDAAAVGAALSRLTDATLEASLEVVMRSVAKERGFDEPPTRMAIIAMGRYGGFELSYGSDADVMFVHDPVGDVEPERAATYAKSVANELRRTLALPATDPALEVDADLRPEGKQGPLVRTLESYAGYYRRWSAVWEFQALLRAEAVVGDPILKEQFTNLMDPLRFPETGITEDDAMEVRRIKARVDNERLPRGADPKLHFKLGRGGLADVEWTVQLLQMQYAGTVEGLRTPRTLAALDAAREAELLSAEDAQELGEAWRMVSAYRNAVTLARGKPYEQLPTEIRERTAVGSMLGYEPGELDDMLNDYLRTTRRAHRIVERLFWGER